jgi:hypothetical protein
MRQTALLIILGAGLSLSGAAESVWQGKLPGSFSSSGEQCFQRISDTISDLWLVHSNRMAFGKPFQVNSPFPDDEEQVENLPYEFNANFPAGSYGEYLYAAGLWVGGIKGDDTLLSHAFDYVAPVPELNPLPCPEGAFQTVSGWADVEYIAVAYDTIILGDTLFRCQVGDCHDWYPLGIKVTSHSYTWESPPYDRSIIIEYTIENIDSLPIQQGWAGIYADCDIDSYPNTTIYDDVSGFVDGAIDSIGNWIDLNIGYSHDMNGDPGGMSYFGEHSSRGALGVQLLGLSVPDYQVNFNWWIHYAPTNLEYAPRQDTPELRDLGGSMAIAYGDSNKYFVMSYPEVDYNQVEAALNHPGWLLPDERADLVANGDDTRFVISAGPFDLLPGDSVTFTVAFVAGDNVINNPYIDLWFDPASPMSVSDYYEELDLSELIASGMAAKSIFHEGFHLPPPGPPPNFRLTDYDDDYAAFVWFQKHSNDMAGYRLLQKSGEEEWQVMAVNAAEDTIAVFGNLNPEETYSFAIAAFDTGGAVGKMTPITTLVPKMPHAPAIFIGTASQTYPVLEWSPSIDSDIAFYRLYRIEDPIPETLVIAEVSDTVYMDFSVAAARSYEYFVTAVTDSDMESLPSASDTLVPLVLTTGILALNANSGNITQNLVFDLDFVDTLFARGLDGIGYTARRADVEHPVTIYDLASYSLVIVSDENRGGSLTGDLSEVLSVYLDNGGKVIFILRHSGIEEDASVALRVEHFGSYSFFSRYLMVDSGYIGPIRIDPGYQLVGDLVGAAPTVGELPPVSWDSVKVNQFGYNVYYGLPYCGYLWPRSPCEIIYRYQSSDPDSTTQNQVNGIRYKGEDYQFYLLNFPLSLMEIDSAAAVLRAAVVDLGEHFICGDVNADARLNIGDAVAYIGYLYRNSQPDNLWAAGDVDCSGEYDMADVLVLINFCCGKGLAPGCCP